MAIDEDALRRQVGAGAAVGDATLLALLATAADLLTEYIGDNEVPDSVLDRAHLVVSAEMFFQDHAPGGIVNQQYDTGDGAAATPIRIGRDPLKPAYPLLSQWVSGKFFCA